MRLRSRSPSPPQNRADRFAARIGSENKNESETNRRERQRAIQEVLVQLFGILLCSGKSDDEVRECAISSIKTAKHELRTPLTLSDDSDAQDFGSILRTWHRSAKFLSTDGFPRALRIGGKSGLHALIGMYFPQSQVGQIFFALRTAGLIKEIKRGQWVPTGKHAVFPLLNGELLGHLSEGVSRLVETVITNVTAERKEDVLFERSAKVRRFPASSAPEFREFVKNQAVAFLSVVDDWMEAREEAAKGIKGKKCTAGVFTFAFMDKVDRRRPRALNARPTRMNSR